MLKFSRMDKRSLAISVLAIAISFIGGFLLANALNKTELDALRSENSRLKISSPNPTGNNFENTLSDEEIRQKIAAADENPSDLNYQKSLGTALYRYAAIKQDTQLLREISRLLNRAFEKKPKDYDLLITLGNLHFDIGYFEKNNDSFSKAREFYQKALELKPKDSDLQTDYALTFYLQNPPETERAVAEFKKSLQENPKHEKTLQFLTQALVKQGKTEEAENYLARLKEINPKTPTLAEIQTQIAQSETLKK